MPAIVRVGEAIGVRMEAAKDGRQARDSRRAKRVFKAVPVRLMTLGLSQESRGGPTGGRVLYCS